MRLSDLTETTADALRSAGAALLDLMTPTLRLGVTGLARSGKTVFITALVRNLVAGGRLPFFAAMAEGRIARAYLEPQPDDAVPRFAYEEHLAELAARPAAMAGEHAAHQPAARHHRVQRRDHAAPRARAPGGCTSTSSTIPASGCSTCRCSTSTSPNGRARAVAEAQAPHARRGRASAGSRSSPRSIPTAPADEQMALTGADLFTRYLQAARAPDPVLRAPGPGRFLLPGDLAGSPLLTFFPLPPPTAPAYQRGTLAAMLARRFESYKTHVVQPFFRDHFARLDRQIVLVDALSAVNAGADALARPAAHPGRPCCACFRPGANTGCRASLAPRIDRLLFAATKADHLHHTSHDRLEAILRLLADKAIARAAFAGAEVKVMALAALRATREAEARIGPAAAAVHRRRAAAGRAPGRQGVRRQDRGRRVPGRPAGGSGEPAGQPAGRRSLESVHFLRFRPPRLSLEAPTGEAPALPHIRLDRALEFLLGDRLA